MSSPDDPFATRDPAQSRPTDPLVPAPDDPFATRDAAATIPTDAHISAAAADDPFATRDQAQTVAHAAHAGPHDTTYESSGGHTTRPAHVPGHEILAELGRGGMGVVYRARQVALNRTVALKMILGGSHAGDQSLVRFRAEAEAIARLQHPNIVQVYEVGVSGGLPYFSLEYCAAGSLSQKLSGKPMAPAEAAELIETLARAMAAAHRASIVHRDLKPANILLTADGVPKIADFGLAKKLDDAALTASGAVMGTPSYMAPEQARGEGHAIGPATDIYALGAILYECLTGRPPFKADSAFQTITHVIKDEPVRPSVAQRRVPRDLETICLKCLQKSPGQRYAMADELADDLKRYRAGEPIKARPISRTERLLRRARRNPLLTGLAAVVLVLLCGIGVLLVRGNPFATEPPAAVVPAVVVPAPKAEDKEDELLKIVAELNKSDPGWRLEQLEAKRQTVPPLKNSALRIIAARVTLPAGWAKRHEQIQPAFEATLGNAPPNPAQLAALQSVHKGTIKSLAEARIIAGLPEGHHVIEHSRNGLTTRLPHVPDTRVIVELLALDARALAWDGHADKALVSCRAAINASRSLNGEPFAISQLTRIAGLAVAVRGAEWVLGHATPPELELQSLQALLEREAADPVALVMARGERGMLHWLMSAVTSGDFDIGSVDAQSKDNPDVAVVLKGMPTGLAARHAHAWSLRHITRFVAIAQLPDDQQSEAAREWEQPLITKTAPNGAGQMLPAAGKMIAACLRHRAETRCAAIALACERYRLKYDAWPEKLADLVPDFVKAVPADPYDGGPLRFRRLTDGVIVYSVGPDRKDDGGMIDAANPFRDGSDFGFRLWDVSARNLPMPNTPPPDNN